VIGKDVNIRGSVCNTERELHGPIGEISRSRSARPDSD
jgi:hypothetical protein